MIGFGLGFPHNTVDSGPSDPLAGFNFQLRLEARGSRVGFFKDVGATMPAALGDSVGAVIDAYGTGGAAYTQATALSRPSYVLGTDGKPVLRWNGVATRLDPPGGILPGSIFALLKNTQPAPAFTLGRIFCDNSGDNGMLQTSIGAFSWNARFSNVTDAIGVPTAGYDLIEAGSGPGTTYTALNNAVTPQDDGVFAASPYTIGDFMSGGQALQADMIGLWVLAISPSDAQRTIIANYALSLL